MTIYNGYSNIKYILMDELFLTPFETAQALARSAREKRLSLNLSQQSLSATSGVSYSVIKKFELTGKISLESLLKIAAALGCLTKFSEVFKHDTALAATSLDDLMRQQTRKRGRK
jgi:transcriptional regulator with XRE-family HTH domain